MIVSILQHTPVWVFAIFAVLVWLGLQRTRTTAVPVRRLLILPLAMGAFSLFGLVSALGAGAATLAVWACGYVLVVAIGRALPRRDGVQYSFAEGTVRVPGSWLPLALMMTIFFLRYAVAVVLAMNPALRIDALFAIVVAALYGITSASFAARTLRIWRSRTNSTTTAPSDAIAA